MGKVITNEIIERYRAFLEREEKSNHTINKYIRDVRKLWDFAEKCGATELSKDITLLFKDYLYNKEHYKIDSVNSIISTVNRFLDYMGWYDLRVKTYKVQKEAFASDERYMTKDEYIRLLSEARKQGKKRLYLIMETLASTGMRVSELNYVTVESMRNGVVEVNNKGKIRRVLLSNKMKRSLMIYAVENNIHEGCIFRTSKGKPVDRSNVWKEMKALSKNAGIDECKVYPHSLRSLFARSLYAIDKDIVRVADILGHSNIETTRRYIRQTQKQYQKILNKLQLVVGYW